MNPGTLTAKHNYNFNKELFDRKRGSRMYIAYDGRPPMTIKLSLRFVWLIIINVSDLWPEILH